MIAPSLAIWTAVPTDRTATAAPRPRPYLGPVLMGDILAARSDIPEFVRQWRHDRDRAEDEDA